MKRLSLRTFLILITFGAVVIATLSPALQEKRAIDELRTDGAEIATISALPDFAPKAARESIQHGVDLWLQTPAATASFLRQRGRFPHMRQLCVVGSDVDYSTASSLVSLTGLRSLELDSTLVTASQSELLCRQNPDVVIARTYRWLNQSIDHAAKWPRGISDKPMDVIPVVNYLRAIGKEGAIDALQQYCDAPGSQHEFNLRHLMPLVFCRDESLRTPCACVPEYVRQAQQLKDMHELLDLLEHPDTEDGLNDAVLNEVLHTRIIKDRDADLSRCDLRMDYKRNQEYLFVVGDIPFVISGHHIGGYSCTVTSSHSPAYLLDCARRHGRIIERLLHPVDNPQQLRRRVLEAFSKREKPDQQRLNSAHEQFSAAIKNLTGDILGPSTWDEQRQAYRAN